MFAPLRNADEMYDSIHKKSVSALLAIMHKGSGYLRSRTYSCTVYKHVEIVFSGCLLSVSVYSSDLPCGK